MRKRRCCIGGATRWPRWRTPDVRHCRPGDGPGAPPPDHATLSALSQALAHRGPDGAGHSVVGRTALVHTRLAIVDVAGGDQPLFAGAAALVANGEVYNNRELRSGLPETRFATQSDCEPPLHLWLRDGAAYASTLRGMYAIAIHERVQRSLTLSRIRSGSSRCIRRSSRAGWRSRRSRRRCCRRGWCGAPCARRRGTSC